MESWDEVRTAFQVARLGTVSRAAEVLGVHHATVIRHIDSLEKRLGVKLFQRHARGYTPTEAGRDLLGVAQTTEAQFAQLASRIKGQGEVIAGELVVTTISGIADLLFPIFADFQNAHPQITIRYLTDARMFRLDHGEAQIAIRAGRQPQEQDYIVQPFIQMPHALYAARSYAKAHGLPAGPGDFVRHRFISHDDADIRAPFYRWLHAHIPPERIVFRSAELSAIRMAIETGIGIGFQPVRLASKNPELIEIMPTRDEWTSPAWIVTHVDLHRTMKIQALINHLKAAAIKWDAL